MSISSLELRPETESDEDRIFGMIGIGMGPANIALAIALEEAGFDDVAFIESSQEPVWQSGMLLEGSDIQHNPHRDLVSLRDPKSPYSFMNFLFERGRLIHHLNQPSAFPLRREYAEYISWARKKLKTTVFYGEHVNSITLEGPRESPYYRVATNSGRAYLCRSLVLGPGRSAQIPSIFLPHLGTKVVHLNEYLPTVNSRSTDELKHVTLVGGSQSAVEIALDLLNRFPNVRVDIVTRSWSLRAKDHSPFSEEIYFPEFTSYYHSAPIAQRRQLDTFTRPTNYSAADLDVLETLYSKIYEQRLQGDQRCFVHGNIDLQNVTLQDGRIEIHGAERVTGRSTTLQSDLVVLATGFKDMGKGDFQEPHHPLLKDVAKYFSWTADGFLDVAENYELLSATEAIPPLFLNGLCESTHGIGDAGSFSLLSMRAATIANSVMKFSSTRRMGFVS